MRNWNRPCLRKNVHYAKSRPGKVAETPITGQANVNQEVPTNIIQFEKLCHITTMDMYFQNQL